jgi:C_GCAxxG_C_C family probable redox protein
MSRSENAIKKFTDGYNCAQSVLFSYSDKAGITDELALKAGCGFGAGMGRKQEVCGAVTGGVLALGLMYGRGENEDQQKLEFTYAKVRELIDRFNEMHETVSCRELLGGCELLTPEGRQRFISENLKAKCCDYVGDVVKILDEITEIKQSHNQP